MNLIWHFGINPDTFFNGINIATASTVAVAAAAEGAKLFSENCDSSYNSLSEWGSDYDPSYTKMLCITTKFITNALPVIRNGALLSAVTIQGAKKLIQRFDLSILNGIQWAAQRARAFVNNNLFTPILATI